MVRTRSFEKREISYTYVYDQDILGVGGLKVGGWIQTTSQGGLRTASDSRDFFQHLTAHTDFGGHQVTYTYDYAAHLKHQESNAGQSIDFTYYANGYLKENIDNKLMVKTWYEYDNEGNRTREVYTGGVDSNPVNYQMAGKRSMNHSLAA